MWGTFDDVSHTLKYDHAGWASPSHPAWFAEDILGSVGLYDFGLSCFLTFQEDTWK